MKKINKKYMILILIILLTIIGGIFMFKPKNNQNLGETVYIEVYQDDTVVNVIDRVIQAGVKIDYNKLYKEFINQDAKIYVNTYELKTNMNAKEIVDILNNPQTNFTGNKFVIFEGDNILNIATRLAHASNNQYSKEDILNYWNNKNTIKELINKYWFLTDDILNKDILYPLEGYFGCATYPLVSNFTIEEMTSKFLDAQSQVLEPYRQANKRNNLSINEVLTLASIIERETMTDSDKYKVSGVFHNRIEQNMPLQSDITVLYALGEHKEHVLYSDLEVNSPYNTYKNQGLPPGPISMVSPKAIDASINPEDNDYLYFFAKQHTGEVIYSKTLEEHEKVSQEYAWE